MHRTVVVDGAGGGDERLPRHLTPEDALPVLVGVDPAEDVDLDRLEVEQVDEGVDGGLVHGPSLPAVGDNQGRLPPTGRWGR